VLAGPANQLLRGGLALDDPFDPCRPVERAARIDQLLAHLGDERLSVEPHHGTSIVDRRRPAWSDLAMLPTLTPAEQAVRSDLRNMAVAAGDG
jgi:hypothetical protein